MFSKLKKLFTRAAVNPVVPLNQAYNYFADLQNATGVSVNIRSVLGNPPVRRAIELVSSKVGMLPLNVYKYGANDSREKDYYHAAYWLLRRHPSDYYTPYQFKRTMQAYAMIYGNAYAAIMRDEFAAPLELLILDPTCTWIDWDKGELVYKTILGSNTPTPKPWTLSPADVLHIKGLGDGLQGWNLLDTARDALGLGLALQTYAATYFRNNAQPRVIVQPGDEQKGPNGLKKFKDDWLAMYSGIQNSNKPGFMPTGAKITTIDSDNENSQFLQSREFDLLSVANIFNLPGSKTGSKNNVSYGSLEMDERAFLADSIELWLHEWEEQCEAKLLTEYEKRVETRYIEFDRAELIQIDKQTEITLLKDEWLNDMISFEEMRAKLNMPTKREGTYFSDLTKQAQKEAQAEVQKQLQQQQPPEDQPEQPDEQTNEADTKLRQMTRQTVQRLIMRCRKSAEEGKFDRETHQRVFVDQLQVWPRAEEWADFLLDSIQIELRNVLPEQYPSVFDRINTEKLLEELWKSAE